MALNKQVFTNAGIDMLGQANAGAQLVIQRMVIGSGTATGDPDIYPLVALINWQANVTITRQVDLGGGQMLVSGTLNEWDMPPGAAFQLRELGIMAYTIAGGTTGGGGGSGTTGTSEFKGKTDLIRKLKVQIRRVEPKDSIGTPTPAPKSPAPVPTTSDQLYCASNCYADSPSTVTPGGTTSWAFDVTVEIDRATDVTITIGGVTTYDAENIPTDPAVGPGWYAGRVSNVFQFKRAVQGPGILLTDSTDRVTISLAELAVNTDIYVPTSYPSPPPGAPLFDTIQQAHDYLLQFRIPASVQATIHVYSGVFNVSGNGIVFTHPDSKQINLIGQPRVDRTGITAINYVAPNKNVLVPGVMPVVGQQVYLWGTKVGWVGGARVVNTIAGGVNLSILNRSGKTPYSVNETSLSGSRLSWLPTRVVNTTASPTAGQNCLTCLNGIGSIQNMVFEGGYYVLALAGGGQLTAVMCIGGASPKGNRGLSLGTGDFGLHGECIICDCVFGIVGIGTLQAYDQTVVNGCQDGIYPSSAGFAVGAINAGMPTAILYLSHCLNGLHARGGNFLGGAIAYVVNGTGMRAEGMSSVYISGASNPSLQGTSTGGDANTLDLYAQGGSYLDFNKGPLWPGGFADPSFSPPHDNIAGDRNQNAYIHYY